MLPLLVALLLFAGGAHARASSSPIFLWSGSARLFHSASAGQQSLSPVTSLDLLAELQTVLATNQEDRGGVLR